VEIKMTTSTPLLIVHPRMILTHEAYTERSRRFDEDIAPALAICLAALAALRAAPPAAEGPTEGRHNNEG